MGFTRRYEAPWRKAFELLRGGAIGPLQMMQIRAVIPYHVFFHRWHRRRAWSGGALNDKSSHHCDVLNWFAESECERLSAFGGRSGIFKPDPDAPARCLECERECPYRTRASRSRIRQDELDRQGDSWINAADVADRPDNCVYLPGADIYDHAICQFAYANGVKASLFWCIYGPSAEDQETLELVGSSGRIVLTRHSASLDIVSEYGKKRETIECKGPEFGSSHFGADLELIREMRRFCEGRLPVVSAVDGYRATRMIEAINLSIDAGGARIMSSDLPRAELDFREQSI
ncbi:MAG: putative oxidoreductase YteT precursor [candidate division BRC1 bacterium ADurb.BinA364]|nr:MAG: putative oxidoreductase YteT precursor [candidate division BRC1 bacterium ADurb.BinA364]